MPCAIYSEAIMNPCIIAQQQASLLPKRPKDSHKGMFGTVVVIGGATGMVGAAILAGRAALKLGAGCVHVGLLADHAPTVDMRQPELMMHSASPLLHPHLSREGDGHLFNHEVVVMGCGMGRDENARNLLHGALQSLAALVLDADALNLLASHADLRELLQTRKAETILTPHPGEAAHLLACSTDEIQANRIKAVLKLAQRYKSHVVLKGANSLCASARGELYVNNTGNPGMSAPGMGDVLAGMTGAFIAQGMSALDALLLAVHLHGAAGDALEKQTPIGMTASELTDQARLLLGQWTSSSTLNPQS